MKPIIYSAALIAYFAFTSFKWTQKPEFRTRLLPALLLMPIIQIGNYLVHYGTEIAEMNGTQATLCIGAILTSIHTVVLISRDQSPQK